ncbi:MAG: hypothetical protein M3P50_01375 [Actinomycetota bacterium]|nr:hypothetical protein [Actinomycetota bacterium]
MTTNALDRLDPRRFDAEEICRRLNEFADLTDAEREDYLADWDYAGLEDRTHPFGALLFESHNACYVVRDLDGRLQLLWQDDPSGVWRMGNLSAGHVKPEAEIAELIEQEELAIDAELALAALAELEG